MGEMAFRGKEITLPGSNKKQHDSNRKRKPNPNERKRWSENWNGFEWLLKLDRQKERHVSILMISCEMRRSKSVKLSWNCLFLQVQDWVMS
jgi:hypothetical protein